MYTAAFMTAYEYDPCPRLIAPFSPNATSSGGYMRIKDGRTAHAQSKCIKCISIIRYSKISNLADSNTVVAPLADRHLQEQLASVQK